MGGSKGRVISRCPEIEEIDDTIEGFLNRRWKATAQVPRCTRSKGKLVVLSSNDRIEQFANNFGQRAEEGPDPNQLLGADHGMADQAR